MSTVSFFFKQKTAYEVRISDWSSDVCSADLLSGMPGMLALVDRDTALSMIASPDPVAPPVPDLIPSLAAAAERRRRRRRGVGVGRARTSVVSGKSGSVRVAVGCGRIVQTKKQQYGI